MFASNPTLGLKKDGVSDDDFKTLVDATLTQHDANADGGGEALINRSTIK